MNITPDDRALLILSWNHSFARTSGIYCFMGKGASETAPIISTNSTRKHKLGSSGIIVSGLNSRICDEKGNEMSKVTWKNQHRNIAI